jgi:hypothetical protein
VQLSQDHDCLSRQRPAARDAAASSSSLMRAPPNHLVEVDFLPTRHAQFAQSDEQERRELKRKPGRRLATLAPRSSAPSSPGSVIAARWFTLGVVSAPRRSIASSLAPTRPNESANSFRFNRVFQHNRLKLTSSRCRSVSAFPSVVRIMHTTLAAHTSQEYELGAELHCDRISRSLS